MFTNTVVMSAIT